MIPKDRETFQISDDVLLYIDHMPLEDHYWLQAGAGCIEIRESELKDLKDALNLLFEEEEVPAKSWLTKLRKFTG